MKKAISSGIWIIIHNPKTNNLFKGSAVIGLEFKLFISDVKMLLENHHLVCDHVIDPLAACVAPAVLRISPSKQRPE